MRIIKFGNGSLYHIFTKSIAGYRIFNHSLDYKRFLLSSKYYQVPRKVSFSTYIRLNKIENYEIPIEYLTEDEFIVKIITYCLMPTHIHFILQQLKDNGISTFMNNVLNSYSRYFNLKIKRKGPLWEGRFKSVLIESDEQLIHLTRYIHLNPVTAYIVDKPEKWQYSSYQEYCEEIKKEEILCNFHNILDIKADSYKRFVEDNISFQRELSKIKKLLIE